MDDDLWALIEPLLPPRPEKSLGPCPVADRPCLQSILYVPRNCIALQLRPLELELGSGRTSRRRLERRRQQDGVSDQLHRIRAKKGNAPTGQFPVDRRKTCSNHHLIHAGRGTPLKLLTTPANVNDVTPTRTLAPLASIPPVTVTERPGRPPLRPEALPSDKNPNPNRRYPRMRQILLVIPRTDAPNIKAWANSATSRRRPLPRSTHDCGTRTYRSFRACASQEPLHSRPLGAHADAVGSKHRSFRSSGEMHAGI
ncbi:transposase [Streptomyces sp. NPDC086082]|uniref:transposase n=1 Tax=Streptomyces sp. NPDC086082 TaxID=3365750 RepID=UPI0037F4B105